MKNSILRTSLLCTVVAVVCFDINGMSLYKSKIDYIRRDERIAKDIEIIRPDAEKLLAELYKGNVVSEKAIEAVALKHRVGNLKIRNFIFGRLAHMIHKFRVSGSEFSKEEHEQLLTFVEACHKSGILGIDGQVKIRTMGKFQTAAALIEHLKTTNHEDEASATETSQEDASDGTPTLGEEKAELHSGEGSEAETFVEARIDDVSKIDKGDKEATRKVGSLLDGVLIHSDIEKRREAYFAIAQAHYNNSGALFTLKNAITTALESFMKSKKLKDANDPIQKEVTEAVGKFNGGHAPNREKDPDERLKTFEKAMETLRKKFIEEGILIEGGSSWATHEE